MLSMMNQRSPVSSDLNIRMPRRSKQIFLAALKSNWLTRNGRLKTLEKLSSDHPEGTILTMYAGELFQGGKHEEAIEVANKALNAPFLIPAARDLAMMTTVVASFLRRNEIDEEAEYRRLQDFVARERIKPTLLYPAFLGFYAARAGDYELANEMFMHAKRVNPATDNDHWTAYSALKSQDYARALRLIRRKHKTPDYGPPMSVEEIELAAVNGMREMLVDSQPRSGGN